MSRKFSFCYAIASATAAKTLAQKEKLKATFHLNEHTLPERSALLPQYLIKKGRNKDLNPAMKHERLHTVKSQREFIYLLLFLQSMRNLNAKCEENLLVDFKI